MPRRFRIAGLVILVLIAALCVSVYALTHHYNAAAHVTARLAQQLGGRVQLDRANVGLTNSTAEGLKLFETEEEYSHPYLTADRLSADVSMMELLKGVLPKRLSLHGVSVHLRFDRDGNLLTRLPLSPPGEVGGPEISIDNASLTITQEGRPDFAVHRAAVSIRAESGKYVVSGIAADSEWGKWRFSATTADLENAEAHLTSTHGSFTQKMLDGLPFLSPMIWQQVHCEGETSADLTFKVNLKERTCRVHAALEPLLDRLDMPLLELGAENARGKIMVDVAVTRLVEVQMQVAGGVAFVHGELDFSTQPARLVFDVKVKDVDVAKLPRSWDLPADVGGKLTGQATLTMLLRDGKPQLAGTGTGTISDATVADLPTDALPLWLTAAEQRYQFTLRPGRIAE